MSGKTSGNSAAAVVKRLAASMLVGAFCLSYHAAAQTCSLQIQPGTPDVAFDSVFTQNGPGTGSEPAGIAGWTGADSTYSIGLPNGDTAFFFSDSYIGESPVKTGDGTVTADANGLRTRVSNCGPPICSPPTNLYHAHNSVVIRNAVSGALKTLTGPPDLINGYATSYFAPPGAAANNHFFWMGDSAVFQTDALGTQKLWVFLFEFDGSWTYFGSSIAQLSLPSLQIESIQSLLNPPASNVNWGSALWLDGSYGNYTLYIYGMKMTGTQKRPYLARTTATGSLLQTANMTNWTAWDGSSWTVNTLNAAPIIGNTGDPNNAADSISDEYSVKKLHTRSGDSFVLAGMNTAVPFGSWKDIVLYTACQPQGPFSVKTVVYSTPETGYNRVPGMAVGQTLAGTMLTYNPHIHPQFTSKGNLLVSYNINAGNSGDLLFADTYRPRFARVRIKSLQ